MRIVAPCSSCQRDLLLSQFVEGPGINRQMPVVRDAAGPALHPAADRHRPSRRARRSRAGAALERLGLGLAARRNKIRLAGIITERDVVRATASSRPETAAVEEDAGEVARCMLDLRIRHLPVTAADGRLVGMVSMRDLLPVEASR